MVKNKKKVRKVLKKEVRVRHKVYQIYLIYNKVKNNRKWKNLNLLKEPESKKKNDEKLCTCI